MRIFLTGSVGFIGSHLYKILRENHKVKGFDLKVRACFNGRVTRQDIRDESLVLEEMQKFKPNIVIHLAALTGVRNSLKNPQEYYETNITGTHNVLQSAVDCGVKKVLIASSSSVYGEDDRPLDERMECNYQLSPYAVSKKSVEMVCQYFGRWIPITIFRPFTVYGGKEGGRRDQVMYKLIKAAKNKTKFEMYGDGTSSRGYTHIDDLIDGIIKLIDYNPNWCETFNLGGQEEIKLMELISIIRQEFGAFPVKRIERQFADVKNSIANINKAKNLLGWRPTRNFKEEIIKICQNAKDL